MTSKQPDWVNIHGVDPLLQRLADAHPLIFRGTMPPVYSYVEPVWYDLLDDLLHDFEAELGPSGCQLLELGQIKEKFGSLRIYLDLPAPLRAAHGTRLRQFVDAAEVKSARLLKAAYPRDDDDE